MKQDSPQTSSRAGEPAVPGRTDPPPRRLKLGGLLRCLLAVLGLLVLMFLVFINSSLASLAELVHPGGALWTHGVLLASEALAITWFWRATFARRRHLLLVDENDPDERRRFAEELVRRLRRNPRIRQAGLDEQFPAGQNDDLFIDHCLRLLDEKANEEIQRNAKRIFLATALSQNGKLDALIMFVSLCRMVWRVSAIYNQRPHPREIISLYGVVITSAFLALSIEELDIPTEIAVGFGEAFHAMAPAGLTASIPFAGKALQTFTASAVDGAANCYLGLRAGIITRNAYSYGARQYCLPTRAAVYKEAGGLLLGMSHVMTEALASTLAEGLAGAAGYVGKKTATAVRNTGDDLARLGKNAGNAVGSTAVQAVLTVVGLGRSAGNAVGSTAVQAVSAVGGLGKNAGNAVGSAAVQAVSAVGGLGRSAGNAVGSTAVQAVSAVGGLIRRPFTRGTAKR